MPEFSTHKLGGQLWLDLVNTEIRPGGAAVDLIGTPAQLAEWLVLTAVLPSRPLLKDAAALLEIAHQLRAELRSMAERVESGERPGAGAIRRINQVLAASKQATQLVSSQGGYRLEVADHGDEPLRWLAPIAHSAADFITGGDRTRLRHCANPECTIHFYDATKNSARRFCSPALCGNRFKVAAFYRRKRESAH